MTNNLLAAARARFAELLGKPEAVCRLCGGIVSSGTGQSIGTPTDRDEAQDRRRTAAGLPALAGWTRQHKSCADDAAFVLALTGIEVSPVIAAKAVTEAHAYPTPYVGGVRTPGAIVFAFRSLDHDSTLPEQITGEAFAHIDEETRAAFVEIVRKAKRNYRAPGTLVRCTDGPCGACGVAKSSGWHAARIKWSDGTPAPWCAACFAVADRRPNGKSAEVMRLRAVALEALSGANSMTMADDLGDRMRLFAELVDPGHEGTAERWEYAADAWADIRELARRAYPGSLPEPERQYYRDLNRAAEQAAAARDAHEREKAAQAAEQAAGWPMPAKSTN